MYERLERPGPWRGGVEKGGEIKPSQHISLLKSREIRIFIIIILCERSKTNKTTHSSLNEYMELPVVTPSIVLVPEGKTQVKPSYNHNRPQQ